MIKQAKFNIGQIVDHNKFLYRGVIFGVDPIFSLSEQWYEQVAKSRPPKDEPWYHVLVDNEGHSTYVAEKNLNQSHDHSEIKHPNLGQYFTAYKNGMYISLPVYKQ